MKEKATKYIIYRNTIRQMIEDDKKLRQESQNGYYDQDPLFEYTRNTNDFSDEQSLIQKRCSFVARHNECVYVYGDDLDKKTEREVIKAVLNGFDGDLYKYVKEKMLDTEVLYSVSFPIVYTNGCCCFNKYTELITDKDKDLNEDYNYVELDKKDMDKILDNIKLEVPSYVFDIKDKHVYIEYFRLTTSTWRLEKLEKEIEREVNKVIKNKLTYCLKNGKVIIPEEYLKKGEAGIEEWRTLKKNKNKNNNMEKKMLRDMLRDKKDYVRKSLQYLEQNLGTYKTWKRPYIKVEGAWNQTMARALSAELLKDKTKQEILTLSNEEINNMIKEYWLEELEKAKKNVEEIDFSKLI